MSIITITSTQQLQSALQEHERLHIQGRGSKTALHHVDCTSLDLSPISGIIEYQPDEYTFTAYASTPVRDIQTALSQHGQYLPCDPMFSETASLGGTIATNLSGSRRFRYGGVRDFLLGATVMDGNGRIFRVGGKVVKNAAGFDLAKFLVGSLGVYMIMLDVTFKVFPDKPAFRTIQYSYATIDDALSAIYFLNQQPFELDALDLLPFADRVALIARFAGTATTLSSQIDRFSHALQKNTSVQTMTPLDDSPTWQQANHPQTETLIKVPITPKQIPALDIHITDLARRYTVGGNIAWIESDDTPRLSPLLAQHNLTGLQVLGQSQQVILGQPINNVLSDRVKSVLDPQHKLI